jgi:hypothetical protein
VTGPAIVGKDLLYGINSSAFSHREGRPQHRFAEETGTHLSPMSYAEYRMRHQAFKRLPGPDGGVPIRLSSPTAGGIFSLAVGDLSDREYSLIDLVRANRDKVTYEGLECYRSRAPLGRFETMPKHLADRGKAPGRISVLRIAMRAALRYGRPIHIFSGLPHPRKDFFHCDCVDPELLTLLGTSGFRLEELRDAISLLGTVNLIAGPVKSDGLGGLGDVGLAKRFCLPTERFNAACLAWARARDRLKGTASLEVAMSEFIQREIRKMDGKGKTAAIVRLARLANTIQRMPRRDDGANSEAFLFRTAVEAATRAYTKGNRDREGLISFVGGRIDVDGESRQKGSKGFYSAKDNRAEGQSIGQAIDAFTKLFVDDIWLGDFGGRPPSASQLSDYIAAYRYTFTRGSPVVEARTDREALEELDGGLMDEDLGSSAGRHA